MFHFVRLLTPAHSLTSSQPNPRLSTHPK
ncbi:hypothetical protein M8C21_014489 [Ambrosia artemisiifolia]|uniref:Uncharacterized protein n=1 Tax=Ambrosia artemisiifolia TaxID=4212 RepID=A0AAD5DEW4_AMBAR|nr:hypothetical protein M8C21_014489 [Ambrosia artemisiifolia]